SSTWDSAFLSALVFSKDYLHDHQPCAVNGCIISQGFLRACAESLFLREM
ncbi:unnamed protein product, partial [Musa acuminata subsp. burmannicoides]